MLRTYAGPHPPTKYDLRWETLGGLTPVDVAWFESQPEDLRRYSHLAYMRKQNAPMKLASGTSVKFPMMVDQLAGLSPADLPAAAAAAKARTQESHAALAKALAGINATPPTVTTRAQIDSAFATII
jgi:hypothetical protein